MKTDKSTPQPSKVFDVRRPGKAMASPTSRPVIMGHKPQAQSTQIAVSGIGEAEEQPALLTKEKKIEPVAAPVQSVEPMAQEASPASILPETPEAVPAPEPAAPAEEVPAAAQAEETPPVVEQPEASPLPVSEPESVTPATQEEPSAVPAAEVQLEEPEPVIEPLFDKSGIVVSHHDRSKKGSSLKTVLLLLLILILAAVALDLLLDAGILSLNGLPHTDFLTN